MDVAVAILSASGAGQDRAIALPAPGGYLVAVADGAGGTSGGGVAAQYLVDVVSAGAATSSSTDWCVALKNLDRELSAHPSAGLTTGVVALIDDERIVGASVGDSGAWLISGHEIFDLTELQRRKPLLGTGEAVPVPFEARRRGRRVLFGSDGLFKYATPHHIRSLTVAGSAAAAAEALANSVRLRSGALQDDVAVVVAE